MTAPSEDMAEVRMSEGGLRRTRSSRKSCGNGADNRHCDRRSEERQENRQGDPSLRDASPTHERHDEPRPNERRRAEGDPEAAPGGDQLLDPWAAPPIQEALPGWDPSQKSPRGVDDQ